MKNLKVWGLWDEGCIVGKQLWRRPGWRERPGGVMWAFSEEQLREKYGPYITEKPQIMPVEDVALFPEIAMATISLLKIMAADEELTQIMERLFV